MKFLEKLINSFRRFPSVGPKQAERFAMYILRSSDSEIEDFISTIKEIKQNIRYCNLCNNYSVEDVCEICRDNSRINKICVVETPFDIVSIEKTQIYNGRYFVLGSNLAPSGDGEKFIGKIEQLKKFIIDINADEVVIALDATTEGQITALYIKKSLSDMGVTVSRIAYGVPLGADIDYMDSFTLSHALKRRTLFDDE